jgi:hypothetical protein
VGVHVVFEANSHRGFHKSRLGHEKIDPAKLSFGVADAIEAGEYERAKLLED